MRAAEEKDIRHNIEAQGLMCYGEKLLEEYRNSSNEVHIVSFVEHCVLSRLLTEVHTMFSHSHSLYHDILVAHSLQPRPKPGF